MIVHRSQIRRRLRSARVSTMSVEDRLAELEAAAARKARRRGRSEPAAAADERRSGPHIRSGAH
jgi:hypothetical protein